MTDPLAGVVVGPAGVVVVGIELRDLVVVGVVGALHRLPERQGNSHDVAAGIVVVAGRFAGGVGDADAAAGFVVDVGVGQRQRAEEGGEAVVGIDGDRRADRLQHVADVVV